MNDMTQKNTFFDIPDVCQITILTQWVTFSNFGRFNSAVCNKSYRSELQKILKLKECVFDYLLWAKVYNCPKEWNVKNNVKLNGVSLSGVDLVEADCRRAVLSFNGPRLAIAAIDLINQPKKSINKNKDASSSELSFDLFAVFSDLKTQCPNVRHLEVSQCSWYECLQSTDDFKCLRNYIMSSTRLTSVLLDAFQNVSVGYIKALCAAPALGKVEFRDCTFAAFDPTSELLRSASVHTLIADEARLCAHFPNLTELQLRHVTVADIDTIPGLCPLLRTVTLHTSGVGAISNVAIDAMCSNWHDICTLTFGCDVTEQQVLALIRRCTSLTYLSNTFYNSASRNDANPPVIGNGSQLRTLIAPCAKSSTLRKIVKLCPLLQTLHITQPERAAGSTTDNLRAEQRLKCILSRSITSLSLDGYTNMSNTDLLVLMHSKLQKLALRDADKITDDALLTLVPTLQSLRSTSIDYCANISNKVVMEVPRLSPTLRSFGYSQPNGCGCCGNTTSAELFEQLLPIVFPHVTQFDVSC